MTLIAQIFPELPTPKNMVKSISKSTVSRDPSENNMVNGAKTLLKFEWQRLYHIYWSLRRRLTCKNSLLVICEIWKLFPNTLSADGKYSLLYWDYLMQPIPMQLSLKQGTSSQSFCGILKSSLNFEHFQKKDDSHSSDISEITDSGKHG